MYTLDDVIEQGAICGLSTIGEAVLNFELHCSQFLPYSEIPEALKRIHEEYEKRGNGPIPEEVIKRCNEELENYFKQQEGTK